MNNKIIASFTGASGTGKSTLLNQIQYLPNFKTVELSGRPYLPLEGDYVQNSSDIVATRISYGSTVTFAESLLKYPTNNIFFSRCAIDKLAYARALNIGKDIESIIIKEIKEIVVPYVKVFYLPIEFELVNNDSVRGTNELVRRNTDYNIINVLENLAIDYTIVAGTIEERMKIIKSNL